MVAGAPTVRSLWATRASKALAWYDLTRNRSLDAVIPPSSTSGVLYTKYQMGRVTLLGPNEEVVFPCRDVILPRDSCRPSGGDVKVITWARVVGRRAGPGSQGRAWTLLVVGATCVLVVSGREYRESGLTPPLTMRLSRTRGEMILGEYLCALYRDERSAEYYFSDEPPQRRTMLRRSTLAVRGREVSGGGGWLVTDIHFSTICDARAMSGGWRGSRGGWVMAMRSMAETGRVVHKGAVIRDEV